MKVQVITIHCHGKIRQRTCGSREEAEAFAETYNRFSRYHGGTATVEAADVVLPGGGERKVSA